MESYVIKAVEALRKHQKQATTAAPESTLSLFSPQASNEEHRSVELDVAFLTAPEPHRVPIFVELPHEVHNGSVCLVTPPPQRKWKDRIEAMEGVPSVDRVKKIIDTKKLAVKFSDVVAGRALARSYGVFFIHNKVKVFPPQLTGEFLSHQSVPVWLSKDGDLRNSLETGLRTAVIPRRGFCNVTVKVGHTGLSNEVLVSNIMTLFKHLEEKSILTVRVCGCDGDGRRACLTVYAHDYIGDHPELC
eukprot:Tbor_TRINITY_DN3061_c0_g2::TRINITY_DN3061_c0_g2_i2::g.17365::m.17365/K14775/UTP30, RSL1D1; ribosome biogenesis protein UTP30